MTLDNIRPLGPLQTESEDLALHFAALDDIVGELNRQLAPLEGATCDHMLASREKAEVSRTLLYAAHLADLVKMAVMNEYFRFKGEQPPSITL